MRSKSPFLWRGLFSVLFCPPIPKKLEESMCIVHSKESMQFMKGEQILLQMKCHIVHFSTENAVALHVFFTFWMYSIWRETMLHEYVTKRHAFLIQFDCFEQHKLKATWKWVRKETKILSTCKNHQFSYLHIGNDKETLWTQRKFRFVFI